MIHLRLLEKVRTCWIICFAGDEWCGPQERQEAKQRDHDGDDDADENMGKSNKLLDAFALQEMSDADHKKGKKRSKGDDDDDTEESMGYRKKLKKKKMGKGKGH